MQWTEGDYIYIYIYICRYICMNAEEQRNININAQNTTGKRGRQFAVVHKVTAISKYDESNVHSAQEVFHAQVTRRQTAAAR